MKFIIIFTLLLSIISPPIESLTLPQYVCSSDTFQCSDGSSVSRDAQNNCQFPKCPTIAVVISRKCPTDECIDPYGQCQGSVLCFANPCQVSKCDAAAMCESNYCGGCHAVFKDFYGNIIDPTNCAIPVVGCGINHCTSYNDGCNVCDCNVNGYPLCSKSPCFIGAVTRPFCTGCAPGYRLNPTSNQCDSCICTMEYDPVCCSDGKTYGNQCQANCQQANGCSRGGCSNVILPTPSICGGFSNCVSYYDGCNSCFCGEGGMVGCTARYCFTKGISKCSLCKTGYTLVGNECVQSTLAIL